MIGPYTPSGICHSVHKQTWLRSMETKNEGRKLESTQDIEIRDFLVNTSIFTP